MKYRDLVQFEPIETIIQIQEADVKTEAAHLVRTYVISDRMADQLTNLVFPQLQLDRPLDNKGLLVVGNYGTGKSHLMSLISALAEHSDLVDEVRNPAVRAAAAQISGRFQVLRMEIGGVETSLRNIVLHELELFLDGLGISYTFPPADQITNNKAAILQAMTIFQERYPEQGILLVIDELLDYLRTRRDQALIMDLGFLRELGEVVELTPFRLMAGVQETLFDNPRFEFVAESLRRVRDRFEQVRIAREDIAYVVAQRLLRKSDEQIARITGHLRAFAPLYPRLAERIDEYARLFPIHPDYLDTFERVYLAEKREVLKTFSLAMRTVMDRDLPPDQPGLISYDHYWDQLRENPALRTMPGVADVVEKSNVLEGRIRNAYTRPPYREMALRLVKGLSVQRLTTSDLHAPIGVTAEELRDGLCLWTAMPQADAELLLGTVQVSLREIMRTVSGQYISYNDANGQYYLDLKKDIDFAAKIAQRGESLEDNDLNRYFFDALRQLLNLSTSVYVTGYSIWEYELPWAERNVTRPGYLFFGLPNQRSTAQPPRDFYVYFLPPFDRESERYQAGQSANEDEVFFALAGLDESFKAIIRAYGGARSLAQESPTHRDTYGDEAEKHLQTLKRWLTQNLTGHLHTTHRGVTRPIAQVLAQTRRSASPGPEDLLRTLAAQQLTGHFVDKYPTYPTFSRLTQPISESARPTAAMDAIRFIARRMRTNLAVGVLTGLQLLDESETLRPLNSPYARHFLDKLHQRPEGQVVNYGEVLEMVSSWLGGAIYKDLQFQLEPPWVAVILIALVYDGQITLNLGGNDNLDAANVEVAATRAIDQLGDFRYYGRPKSLPLPLWTLIFDGFGLQSALLREENTRAQAVIALQQAVQAELRQVVTWQQEVQNGLRLWNESLFTDGLHFQGRPGDFVESQGRPGGVSLSQTDLLPYLRKTKEFLEALARFDTPGKLRNLRLSATEINELLDYRRTALRVREVLEVVTHLQPITSYLSEAGANLPGDDDWLTAAQAEKGTLLDEVRGLARGEADVDLHRWLVRLRDLRARYIARYTTLHNRHVLGPAGDDRKVALMRDRRVDALKRLANISILNRAELEGWINAISAIRPCRDFHEGLLTDTPTCPRCRFRPVEAHTQADVESRLDRLDERLQTMHQGWHEALRQTLRSDTAQQSIAAMSPHERRSLDAYLAADPAAVVPSAELVDAANRALRGMQTVGLHMDDLAAALKAGGLPCTVEDLAQRFANYVQSALRGHDRNNTRLTLEE